MINGVKRRIFEWYSWLILIIYVMRIQNSIFWRSHYTEESLNTTNVEAKDLTIFMKREILWLEGFKKSHWKILFWSFSFSLFRRPHKIELLCLKYWNKFFRLLQAIFLSNFSVSIAFNAARSACMPLRYINHQVIFYFFVRLYLIECWNV